MASWLPTNTCSITSRERKTNNQTGSTCKPSASASVSGFLTRRRRTTTRNGLITNMKLGFDIIAPPRIKPITYTLKPFLAKKGHAAEDVEKMHQAWIKSVILQITLWSQPYVKDGDF